MKKILLTTMLILTFCTVSYGYTKKFEYMASVMDIELKTESGIELNEEIFDAYNQFVYGSPLIINSSQRWKDVSDGKWTKNSGIWKGSGTRGEYWILGLNYSEEYVHNHFFPVDIEPPTPPTKWRYVILSDALDSWNDSNLYLHEEQKTYMQTAKLTRNNTTYDITALDIGLDKAKVENYATWKTNGNIYTKRYDMNNVEWAANFIVPPMAADAELISNLELVNGDTYTIHEGENSITIPIEFGCNVINLTDYAKQEHVKTISSEVEIEGRIISSINDTKKISVSKDCNLIIDKNDYPNQSIIELEINCNSLLITEFITDSALVDTCTKIVTIKVEGVEESKEIIVKREDKTNNIDAIPPHIDNIELGKEESGKVVSLPISKKTNSEFICAGQVLTINVEASNTDYITIEFSGDSSIVTLDELTKKFEWDDPRSRGVSTRFRSIESMKMAYGRKIKVTPYKSDEIKSYYKYSYVIPYKTKQTLHSWSTIRELSKDAFNIDENILFNRIKNPYQVVIKAYSGEGVRTKSVQLDVFERWDTLYNRDLKQYLKSGKI